MPQAAPNAHEGEEDNGDIPPAFNPDMTMQEMKASFKSNKDAQQRIHHHQVTGLSNTAERVLQQILGEV